MTGAHQHFSKSAWFMQQTRCPVSGLPVTNPVSFVSQFPGTNFSMEMATLGNRIILVKTAGYMRSVDEDEFLACFEDYRSKYFPGNKSLFVLEDYAEIQGAEAEARKKYVAYFRDSDFLIGGVIYHLSPLFKISFNLAKRLQIFDKDMYAEDSYARAIRRAVKLINQSGVEQIYYPPRAGSLPMSPLRFGVQYIKNRFNRFQPVFSRFKLNRLSFLSQSLTKQYSKALLKYIESINWQKDGAVPEESPQYADPSIRQVFDAIGYIKSEVDRLIHERLEVEQELKEYQEKLKGLSIQMSKTQENERRLLASRLHDSVSQELFAAHLLLNTFEKKLKDAPHRKEIKRIKDQIQKVIKETKTLTFDLSPPVLYDFGLQEALESLAASVENKYGISIRTWFSGNLDEVGDEIRIIIYRIISELMQNTVKHADAREIRISLNNSDHLLTVDFEDDGIGFDAGQMHADTSSYEGFGIFDIREKINHLGGNVEIDSTPGSGTAIMMEVPVGMAFNQQAAGE